MRDQGGDVQCTAWRLLDAQFWGVPQRRKRIYLVNDFGNGRAGQILFECESVLGYHSQGRDEEQGNSGNSENSLTGTDCRGMAEDADGQMKLDFGRTADRIYINAKTSVTLMGNAGIFLFRFADEPIQHHLFIGERDMADMTITVKIEDLPEFKARLARIKKIMRRRAWVNGHRTGKARKSTWKRA